MVQAKPAPFFMGGNLFRLIRAPRNKTLPRRNPISGQICDFITMLSSARHAKSRIRKRMNNYELSQNIAFFGTGMVRAHHENCGRSAENHQNPLALYCFWRHKKMQNHQVGFCVFIWSGNSNVWWEVASGACI